ncbi:hypothetical protein BDA96_01G291200 [Sorghum bicolor]|uniref:VQ domain-containing protein n=1 Tax=Sorghum bicolor TaxID=4558 RepID=A0A921V1Q0_SORBI|nr:hypothetical protein BDA96_09G095800 [Sorghum bicolor]KAG0549866.1 hypothetical protein BDA96_01G291200 [Sorghum bicolor]
MAMEVQGTRRPPQDAGVKVKFIETQFISSDAASFKAVVQRLTGKSPAPASSQTAAHQAPAAPHPQRPRPCRPAFVGAGQQQQQAAGWTMDQQATAGYLAMMPAPKQEPLAAASRLEDMNELCDFADLFYTTTAASARRDGGGSAFPY